MEKITVENSELTRNGFLLSVIIPCYNVEKYLKNCFSCLDNSDYKNLQIIFVDDGSTDNTLNLLKGYINGNKNAELYSVIHGGVANARNAGLDKVKGKYFTFFDVDDNISTNHFSNLIYCAIKTDADICVCNYKRVKKIKPFKSGKNKIKIYKKLQAQQMFFAQKFEYSLWNKIYKTETARANNVKFYNDVCFGEDSAFNYLIGKEAQSFAKTYAETYQYVKSKNSLVRSKFTESRLDIYYGLNDIVNDCKENKDLNCYAHALRSFFTVETLYFIFVAKYKNKTVVDKLISYLKEDNKYLHKCKYVKAYRKLLIPLFPFVYKVAFGLFRNKKFRGELPQSLEDKN